MVFPLHLHTRADCSLEHHTETTLDWLHALITLSLSTYLHAERKKEFKEWRKKHYNEFQVMKKFRERMAREQEEEEEEEEEGEGSAMDTV